MNAVSVFGRETFNPKWSRRTLPGVDGLSVLSLFSLPLSLSVIVVLFLVLWFLCFGCPLLYACYIIGEMFIYSVEKD